MGRLDPKLHRDRSLLEIRALHAEPDCVVTADFGVQLDDAIADLANFLGATDIRMPSP